MIQDNYEKLAQLLLKKQVLGEMTTPDAEVSVSDYELWAWRRGELDAERSEQVRLLILKTPSLKLRLADLAAEEAALDEVEAEEMLSWIREAEAVNVPSKSNKENFRSLAQHFWGAFSDWRVWVPVAVVALLLVFVVWPGSEGGGFEFKRDTTLAVEKVAALMPPEEQGLGFAGVSPPADRHLLRLGYVAAFTRDLRALGDSERIPVLLEAISGEIPDAARRAASQGHNPCTYIDEAKRPSCEAGTWLYALLRDGGDGATSLKKQHPELFAYLGSLLGGELGLRELRMLSAAIWQP
jgi:hypothetical protein